MVVRRGDVAQHRHGRKVARTAVGRAVRVDAPAIGVLRRRSRHIHRRVRFDVARQSAAVRADVSDLDEVRAPQRPLDAGVPVLRIRRLRLVVEREDGRRPDERIGGRVRTSEIRVLEVQSRAAELVELRRRQRADGNLRRGPGSVLELIVEDAEARTHRPDSSPGRIPRHANAGHERVRDLGNPGRDAGVAGKQQAARRVRTNFGLDAGNEGVEPVIDLGEGRDALVAQAVVEGQAAGCAPFVLGVGAGVP